jgi:hypothetical protein
LQQLLLLLLLLLRRRRRREVMVVDVLVEKLIEKRAIPGNGLAL